MTADEFRDAMDNDKAFQSKRKALVFVSLLLLALVVSGAQIKEANTFIFKIEFANHAGLRYLLVASVVACMLRYYSYSEKYRDQLFKIWSGRLLADYRVYHVDKQAGEISGILGKKMEVYIGEYGVDNPKYKKAGFFKRSVGLPAKGMHETYGEIYYTEYFDLNKYDDKWKSTDFRSLLMIEFKYRAEAWIKYRETLDLASPYLLGFSSLLAFAIGLCWS
jgi:hypothetical protein